MLTDVRLALRGFRKSPVFAAVAILSLTLAIGANTAILGLLNALVWRDVPVRDPAQLVQIASQAPNSIYESGLTFPMYRDFLRKQQIFSAVLAWSDTNVLAIEPDPQQSQQQTHGVIRYVGGTFLRDLGVSPVRGRLLDDSDTAESTLSPARVIVISQNFWERELGGSDAAIGRTVRIEGEPFTIVGVVPEDFKGLGLTMVPDVLVPFTAHPIINATGQPASLATSGSFFVRVTGRLKPGVTLAQARAAIETIWPSVLADSVPPSYSGARRDRFLHTRVLVASAATGYEPFLRARYTRPLVIVLAIAAMVLLIACVNLASLLLARAAARAHELGVRLALGASRWRIARQVAVEGLLLALIGAAGGVWFAWISSEALVRRIFADYVVPTSLDTAPDARLLAMTALLAGLAGLLCSVVPAWRAARQDSSQLVLRSHRSTTATGRTGRVLVAAQIGLSLVLLTNAGLLVRTLLAIRAVDSGMRTDDVQVAYTSARSGGGYRGVDNDLYYPQVLERIAAVPGVSSASISLFKPAGGGGGIGEHVAKTSAPPDAAGATSIFNSVSPGFFATLGITLKSGRDFAFRDNSRGAAVAIISDTLARQLFPAGDALGQHLRVGVVPRRQDLEVVGIVADARVYDLKDPNLAVVYVPAMQEPDANYKCFVLRGRQIAIADLNRALDTFGYERVGRTQTLDHITESALLQERMTAALAAFFGALALVLGAIGLYGLMSYDVHHRAREIGIRLALGAKPAQVLRTILRDGLRITAAGVIVGLVGAWASVRLVASLLFGLTPHDPVTLIAAVALLTAVAVLASLLPARRAAATDPMTVMRAE
jgi:predicted permease